MLIVITGLDGSGTTTIANKLHLLDKGSFLLHTPSEEYCDRWSIDANIRNISPMAHYLYYLSSVVYISDYIRKNIDYHKHNVYCVRYLIDTVVSHRVAGMNVELDYEKYNILKPQLTIYVKLDEKIRQKRITRRGKSELDQVLDDEKTRNAFLKEFRKLAAGAICFDNGVNDVELEINNLFATYITGDNNYE